MTPAAIRDTVLAANEARTPLEVIGGIILGLIVAAVQWMVWP